MTYTIRSITPMPSGLVSIVAVDDHGNRYGLLVRRNQTDEATLDELIRHRIASASTRVPIPPLARYG